MSEEIKAGRIPRSNSTIDVGFNSDPKMRRTHSFGSYTKRDFLDYKKVRGAP